MLNQLLTNLQKIIPVKELIDINGNIQVNYFDDNLPNNAQLAQISDILNSWPLDQAKIIKIQQLDVGWKTMLSNGWETPQGYKLGIDISDIALLNGAFTLAKEASLMGINDPVSIVDLDGISHALSLSDLTILMLQYGQARATLSNSYASIKQAINQASSIEEVNSIDLTI